MEGGLDQLAKIYLAARYSRHPEMRLIAEHLMLLGHIVTSRWINGNHDSTPETTEYDSRRYAQEDLHDLTSAVFHYLPGVRHYPTFLDLMHSPEWGDIQSNVT